jgi:hypothetical protein
MTVKAAHDERARPHKYALRAGRFCTHRDISYHISRKTPLFRFMIWNALITQRSDLTMSNSGEELRTYCRKVQNPSPCNNGRFQEKIKARRSQRRRAQKIYALPTTMQKIIEQTTMSGYGLVASVAVLAVGAVLSNRT